MCKKNCECGKEKLNIKELLNYSYYDDSGKLVAVIKEDILKKVFDADIIIFNETEHR